MQTENASLTLKPPKHYRFIKVQGTGEEHPMACAELDEMMRLAEKGCGELFEAQRRAIG